MDFPIFIHTISMGLPILYLRGHRYNFLNYDVFRSLKVVLILANSADPDEMQHYAAFHLGLHCWLVGFVALRPKSTAMVIAGRSIHLTTLFPGQA